MDENQSQLEFHINTQSNLAGLTSYTEGVNASTVATERHTAATKADSAAVSENEKLTVTTAKTSPYLASGSIKGDLSGIVFSDEKARNMAQLQIELNNAIAASDVAKTAEIKQDMAIEISARRLIIQGLEEEEAFRISAQMAAAANAAKATEANAVAQKAIGLADLKILRDSAAAAGMTELSDAYNFQIRVTKEAQTLIGRGVEVNQAYVTATAMVAEADRVEAIETQKAAEAKLLKAAASKKAAAGELEEAGATAINTTTMRELMVVARELMYGRVSRLPGSFSILMGQLAEMTPMITSGLLAASVAGFALFEIIKKTREEYERITEEQAKEQSFVWDEQRKRIAAAATEAERYAEALKKIEANTNAVKNADDLHLATLQAIAEEHKKILAAKEKAEIAASGGDPVKEAEIRRRYADAETKSDLKAEHDRLVEEFDELKKTYFDLNRSKQDLSSAHAANANAIAGGDIEGVPTADAAANAEQRLKFLQGDKDVGEKALVNKLIQLTGAPTYDEAKKKIAEKKQEYENTPPDIDALNSGGFDMRTHLGVQLENMQKALADVDANQKAMAEQTAIITARTEAMKRLAQAEADAESAAQRYATALDQITQKYQKDSIAYKYNSDTARQVESIQQGSDFGIAVKAIVSDHGEKMSAEQQEAIAATKAMFDNIHGNFAIFVKTLQNFHGNSDQLKIFVSRELAALQSQISSN